MVRAAVLHGACDLRIEQFDSVRVGPDDGALQVELAGVCGTDHKTYLGELDYPLPLVLGHEIVGRISRIGNRAAERWGVQPGDRVAVEGSVPCWSCHACWAGSYKMCPHRQNYGTSTPATVAPHLWGAMGEEMYLAPGSLLHRMSDAVPVEAAVVHGVVANAFQWAVEVGGARPGISVVVRGAGPQGIASAVLAARAGADEVVLLGREVDQERLAIARSLGVRNTLVVDGVDVPTAVRELVGGSGVDLVVDASGASQVVEEDVELLRPEGRLVWAGLTGSETRATIRLDRLVWKAIDFRAVFTKRAPALAAATRALEARDIAFERLVTDVYALEDAEQALIDIGGRGDRYPLKAAIRPGPTA